MPPAIHRRNLVLQEIGQCLAGLAEARSAADCAGTLSVLLLRLPLAWHSVDLFARGRLDRRLCSFRCSRGFAPFVTRLGFLKRPDGVYQGTFADTTLLLVKASYQPGQGCFICGVGLEKQSPLTDGAITSCIGALIHEALSRMVGFDDRDRILSWLYSVAGDEEGGFRAVLDAEGRLLHQFPNDVPFPPELLQAAPTTRRSRGLHTVSVGSRGLQYAVQSRWMAGHSPLPTHYILLSARAQSTTPRRVKERLRTYGLSRRESQVAELVFTGIPNRRIAQELFISQDTVKTHCRHIFGKLGIARRTEFFRLLDSAS
jgi:DNA-binding CsgD family transcriptional regulator